MDYFQNHCWCNSSHWDSKIFHARHMVTIDSDVDADNLNVLSYDKKCIDPEMLANYTDSELGSLCSPEKLEELACRTVPTLSDDVLTWLTTIDKSATGEHGWAMGDDSYRMRGDDCIIIWFETTRCNEIYQTMECI